MRVRLAPRALVKPQPVRFGSALKRRTPDKRELPGVGSQEVVRNTLSASITKMLREATSVAGGLSRRVETGALPVRSAIYWLPCRTLTINEDWTTRSNTKRKTAKSLRARSVCAANFNEHASGRQSQSLARIAACNTTGGSWSSTMYREKSVSI